MKRKRLAPCIFCVHLPLQLTNLAFWALLVIVLGLVRFILPFAIVRRGLVQIMNGCVRRFGVCSVGLIRFFNPIDITHHIEGQLYKHHWYLIVANHLSYLDIILLIEFSGARIPPPKFFLKHELIWLPFVGLAAWALEMPFMKRFSREYLAKHPEKRGTDIETTKRYCEIFRHHPTTVINFVEGTRFTSSKHHNKRSPFSHLLPPKAGGIAFTLATMGELFSNMLDVSLVYPDNTGHPMMAMLSGQMTRIIIDVKVVDIPELAKGDYYNDAQFKARFQQWLNDLWATKDKRIEQILSGE